MIQNTVKHAYISYNAEDSSVSHVILWP